MASPEGLYRGSASTWRIMLGLLELPGAASSSPFPHNWVRRQTAGTRAPDRLRVHWGASRGRFPPPGIPLKRRSGLFPRTPAQAARPLDPRVPALPHLDRVQRVPYEHEAHAAKASGQQVLERADGLGLLGHGQRVPRSLWARSQPSRFAAPPQRPRRRPFTHFAGRGQGRGPILSRSGGRPGKSCPASASSASGFGPAHRWA